MVSSPLGVNMLAYMWSRYRQVKDKPWYYAYNKDDDDVVVASPLPKYNVPPPLIELEQRTCFNREDIKKLYRSFKDCFPSGLASKEDFENIFNRFMRPKSNTKNYINYLFKKLDQDLDGDISFEDFLLSYSVICNGPSDELFDWVFDLYNINDHKYVTVNDFKMIFESLLEIRGCKSKWSQDTISKRAVHLTKCFEAADGLIITKENFRKACWKNAVLCEDLSIPVNRGILWNYADGRIDYTYPEGGSTRASSSMDSSHEHLSLIEQTFDT